METSTTNAGIATSELIGQLGVAGDISAVLCTLLWRVIQSSKEERERLYESIQADARRNVDALNSLKDVLIELKVTMQSSNGRRHDD